MSLARPRTALTFIGATALSSLLLLSAPSAVAAEDAVSPLRSYVAAKRTATEAQ